MAIEQFFQEPVEINVKDGVSMEKWNSVSSSVDESENNSSGGFECNICLDSVSDPVVTLCGHLFCWPCIYKWINFQHLSIDNQQQQPQCPVCKAEVSQRSLIPLYGRGQTAKSSKSHLGIKVPRRPNPTCGAHVLVSPRVTHPQQSYMNRSPSYRTSPTYSFGDVATTTTTTDTVHPIVGMFGEMVYARIFGNSEAMYAYPNSYHLAGNNSPRVRRQLMQVDQSLSRVCFFLFCCMVLCLLLF